MSSTNPLEDYPRKVYYLAGQSILDHPLFDQSMYYTPYKDVPTRSDRFIVEYNQLGIENSVNYSKSIGRVNATTTFENAGIQKENIKSMVNSEIMGSTNIAQPRIIPTYLGKEIYNLIVKEYEKLTGCTANLSTSIHGSEYDQFKTFEKSQKDPLEKATNQKILTLYQFWKQKFLQPTKVAQSKGQSIKRKPKPDDINYKLYFCRKEDIKFTIKREVEDEYKAIATQSVIKTIPEDPLNEKKEKRNQKILKMISKILELYFGFDKSKEKLKDFIRFVMLRYYNFYKRMKFPMNSIEIQDFYVKEELTTNKLKLKVTAEESQEIFNSYFDPQNRVKRLQLYYTFMHGFEVTNPIELIKFYVSLKPIYKGVLSIYSEKEKVNLPDIVTENYKQREIFMQKRMEESIKKEQENRVKLRKIVLVNRSVKRKEKKKEEPQPRKPKKKLADIKDYLIKLSRPRNWSIRKEEKKEEKEKKEEEKSVIKDKESSKSPSKSKTGKKTKKSLKEILKGLERLLKPKKIKPREYPNISRKVTAKELKEIVKRLTRANSLRRTRSAERLGETKDKEESKSKNALTSKKLGKSLHVSFYKRGASINKSLSKNSDIISEISHDKSKKLIDTKDNKQIKGILKKRDKSETSSINDDKSVRSFKGSKHNKRNSEQIKTKSLREQSKKKLRNISLKNLNLKPKNVEDKKDKKESKESKDLKESKMSKESKDLKESKGSKESKESERSKIVKEVKKVRPQSASHRIESISKDHKETSKYKQKNLNLKLNLLKKGKDKRNSSAKVSKVDKNEISKEPSKIIEEEIEDITDQKNSSKESPASKLGPLPDLKKVGNNSTLEPVKEEKTNNIPKRVSRFKNKPFNNLKDTNSASNIFETSTKK